MAIGFGNTPLQQRIIKKVQDQASQKTSTKREANPSAIEAAKDPPAESGQVPVEQDNQVSQANSDAASAEQSGGSSYKSPGDQILETLENMSAGAKQADSIASAEATRS